MHAGGPSKQIVGLTPRHAHNCLELVIFPLSGTYEHLRIRSAGVVVWLAGQCRVGLERRDYASEDLSYPDFCRCQAGAYGGGLTTVLSAGFPVRLNARTYFEPSLFCFPFWLVLTLGLQTPA